MNLQKQIKSKLTVSDSIWKPLNAEDHQEIPQPLRNWLIDTGSLTAKLRSACTEFSVHLISQTQRVATSREAGLLALEENDQLIDREVQLYCGTTPVVYARSLIPVKALHDRFEGLDSMGEKPLGEKIFSDPQLDRSPIEWGRLTSNHVLFDHAMENVGAVPDYIFGRRSLFHGAEKPILISEFFLPAITGLMN